MASSLCVGKVSFLWNAPSLSAQRDVAAVLDAQLGKTSNVHMCGDLYLAGQPTPGDIPILKAKGIKRVVTLRADGEIRWREGAAMRDAGFEFIKVPFRGPETLTDDVFDSVRKLLRDAKETPMLLHCGSANRVGAVWLAYRVLDEGVAFDVAFRDAQEIGLRNTGYEAKVRDYVARARLRGEASVRPGINDNFLKADLDVDQWLGRFEVESREVFAAREQVIEACAIGRGARIADIGAGTGFFARLFSERVGREGWVFAVDISPRFLEHIRDRAADEGVVNMSGILCSDRSANLPPSSVDFVFACDTYHHFEYPSSTLASIHRALRDGGQLIVIDFEKIPGQTREFLMSHVRAGKQQVRGEIVAAGFEFVEEVTIDEFRENYMLRFRKK